MARRDMARGGQTLSRYDLFDRDSYLAAKLFTDHVFMITSMKATRGIA
jgi:hypothetical protein